MSKIIKIGDYACSRFGISSMNSCYVTEDRKYFIKKLNCYRRLKSEYNSQKLSKYKNNFIVYDKMFEDKENKYLVYKYYNASDLRENKVHYNPNELMYNILSNFRIMEKEKMVHLDIKPENLLFFPKHNNVKLIDFEFCEIFNKLHYKRILSRKGTLTYISPELYFDNTINVKTDLWSLGVLYAWLHLRNRGIELQLRYNYCPDRDNLYKIFNLNSLDFHTKEILDMMIQEDYKKRKDIKYIMEYFKYYDLIV